VLGDGRKEVQERKKERKETRNGKAVGTREGKVSGKYELLMVSEKYFPLGVGAAGIHTWN
jgi:hypothetical protein